MSEVTATEHVRLQADNHRVDADDSEANIPTERDPAPATRPTSDVGRRTSDMSQDSRIAVAAPTRRAPLPIPEAPVQPELPPPNGHLRSPRERLLHSALSTQRSALVSEALLVGLVVLLLCLCYLSLRWYGFDLLEEGYFLTNARAAPL